MGDETNFFSMPGPEDQPPPVLAPPPPQDDTAGGAPVVETLSSGEEEAGGFTLLGDAPPAADTNAAVPFVGTVTEGDDVMGFAAAPPSADDTMGFAAAPTDTGGYSAPPDVVDGGFAAPPSQDTPVSDDPFAAVPSGDDTPIILGGPPPPTDDTTTPTDVVDGDTPIVIPPPVGTVDENTEPTEPTPMQKWNEEWQQTLMERKDEENTKKSELVEAARLSMENFTKERESKREMKMSKNREDEQAKLEAIEADLENDNSWQRVCKMVELSHEGSVEEAEDVKRMRDVMILLKNEPARAAAVGA